MKQATVTIQNKVGIHARPASLIMTTVNKYDVSVQLEKPGIHIDLKGIIDLLRLQGTMGDEIVITCEGEDEEACLEALVALFETKFGEE
ncbi:MAG: HPr family phosphocarrier protein [Lachnospiraceae bacterium]